MFCLYSNGDVAAACSSGGIALKTPGRAGQAAVYGSGAWAENGPTSVALTTSGCGEHLIRASLAHKIANEVPFKADPTSALHSAMQRHFIGELKKVYILNKKAGLGSYITFISHFSILLNNSF